ncbi:6015_t:CDS:2, partial [Acaulospora morrowiae]
SPNQESEIIGTRLKKQKTKPILKVYGLLYRNVQYSKMAILKLSFFSKQPEAKPWSFPDEPQVDINEFLYKKELGLNRTILVKHGSVTLTNNVVTIALRCPQRYSNFVSSKLPYLLKESLIDLKNHDKIFSSHWISKNEIVVGTKCNKLLILNIETNKRFEIPLVTGDANNQTQENNNNCSGIRNIA